MEPDSTEPDGPHQPPEPQQNNALHIRLKALQGRFNNALPEAATLSPRHQDNISKAFQLLCSTTSDLATHAEKQEYVGVLFAFAMNSAVEQGVEPFRQAVGEGSVTAATAVSLDDMADFIVNESDAACNAAWEIFYEEAGGRPRHTDPSWVPDGAVVVGSGLWRLHVTLPIDSDHGVDWCKTSMREIEATVSQIGGRITSFVNQDGERVLLNNEIQDPKAWACVAQILNMYNAKGVKRLQEVVRNWSSKPLEDSVTMFVHTTYAYENVEDECAGMLLFTIIKMQARARDTMSLIWDDILRVAHQYYYREFSASVKHAATENLPHKTQVTEILDSFYSRSKVGYNALEAEHKEQSESSQRERRRQDRRESKRAQEESKAAYLVVRYLGWAPIFMLPQHAVSGFAKKLGLSRLEFVLFTLSTDYSMLLTPLVGVGEALMQAFLEKAPLEGVNIKEVAFMADIKEDLPVATPEMSFESSMIILDGHLRRIRCHEVAMANQVSQEMHNME